MTGMECLKQEMLKRGCTKTQVESKILPIVVDILAQTGTHYLQHWEDERDFKSLKDSADMALSGARQIYNNAKHEAQVILASARKEENRLKDVRQDIEDYVSSFEASLRNCETAEGRDRLRTAQMFCQTVTIDTKYDNTAYIISLGAILSGGQVAAIDELKKLNPNLGTAKPCIHPRKTGEDIWGKGAKL